MTKSIVNVLNTLGVKPSIAQGRQARHARRRKVPGVFLVQPEHIDLLVANDIESAAHELGHAVESMNPKVSVVSKRFFAQRTVGEKAVTVLARAWRTEHLRELPEWKELAAGFSSTSVEVRERTFRDALARGAMWRALLRCFLERQREPPRLCVSVDRGTLRMGETLRYRRGVLGSSGAIWGRVERRHPSLNVHRCDTVIYLASLEQECVGKPRVKHGARGPRRDRPFSQYRFIPWHDAAFSRIGSYTPTWCGAVGVNAVELHPQYRVEFLPRALPEGEGETWRICPHLSHRVRGPLVTVIPAEDSLGRPVEGMRLSARLAGVGPPPAPGRARKVVFRAEVEVLDDAWQFVVDGPLFPQAALWALIVDDQMRYFGMVKSVGMGNFVSVTDGRVAFATAQKLRGKLRGEIIFEAPNVPGRYVAFIGLGPLEVLTRFPVGEEYWVGELFAEPVEFEIPPP